MPVLRLRACGAALRVTIFFEQANSPLVTEELGFYGFFWWFGQRIWVAEQPVDGCYEGGIIVRGSSIDSEHIGTAVQGPRSILQH